MYKYSAEIVFMSLGILVLIINYLFVIGTTPFMVPVLNMVGALTAVAPPLLILYRRFRIRKQIEEQFIVFIRDLTQSINSGMTLPMALAHCSKRDYLSLTKHVRDMSAQVDWGITFKQALDNFAKRINMVTIKRAIDTIIETYKVGGKISDTLDAVSESLITIDKIKKERSASVHAQIVTSYMIFFVFIFILVILQAFLVPALTPQEIPGVITGTQTAAAAPEIYSESFVFFIIVQGFFAGLATGKMAEGSIVAGFKHSILLVVIGYTVFSFTAQFQIKFF